MNLFSFIKTQIPILQIVNEYTSLKPAGIYWKGLCPFHSEKTPSFTVSPHKDIFYCFGCHENGDVIAFIAKSENYSQIEAAKFLVERYSLKVPKEIDTEFNRSKESSSEKERYFILCQLIANWCHESLKKNKEAFEYIKSRGFNDNIIEQFNVGYFPNGVNNIKSFLKFMNNHSFLAQDLIKSSFMIEGKNLFSPFEERIIFPIKDQIGRYCGFGGRVFKENDERAKYYNSHENSYFNKGSILFGLDFAKKAIQTKNYAFLVEGYTDCIAMTQYGFNNTVATLGTACTLEHLKLVSRFTDTILILYDGDLAGQNAILRLTEICWNVNLELKVICLQDKEDPASFLHKNGNLNELIDSAKDIYTFFIENSGSNFSSKTLHEKIWTVKKLTDIIRNINDQLKQDLLLQEMANKLNVPFESIKKSFKKNEFINHQIKNHVVNNEREKFKISDLEKKLFGLIMSNFDLFIDEYYYLSDFFNSPAKEILNELIKFKKNKNGILYFPQDFFNLLDDDQKTFINYILLENEQNFSYNFINLILQFKKKNWKKITYATQLKLLQAQKSLDKETTEKALREFQELKNKLISGGYDA